MRDLVSLLVILTRWRIFFYETVTSTWHLLKFTALFGVIFELPMVSYVLAKIGVLKHTWMSKYRKYAIIVIFVCGAIMTPPDILSQIMMAVPLVILYEISILVARIAGRKTLI